MKWWGDHVALLVHSVPHWRCCCWCCCYLHRICEFRLRLQKRIQTHSHSFSLFLSLFLSISLGHRLVTMSRITFIILCWISFSFYLFLYFSIVALNFYHSHKLYQFVIAYGIYVTLKDFFCGKKKIFLSIFFFLFLFVLSLRHAIQLDILFYARYAPTSSGTRFCCALVSVKTFLKTSTKKIR